MSNIERYSRQLLLPEFGVTGQKRLRESRVLVVGAGGLGSPVIMYLAAAGVGTLGVIDGDVVDVSNLHRQVIHDTMSLSQEKAFSAMNRAQVINPNAFVLPLVDFLTADNVEETFKNYDFIVDCVDNFAVKYLINDACVILQKPFSHAGVVGWKGQVFTHDVGGPCLRCLVPEPTPRELAPTCSRAGVLGPTVGVVGTIQALEVVKSLACSNVERLTNRVLKVDGQKMSFRSTSFSKRDDCPVCGRNPTITSIEPIETPVCDLEGK